MTSSDHRLLAVLLNGPPGSGKDTAAAHIAGYGLRHAKFASPLREMCAVLHQITSRHFDHLMAPETKDIPHPLLGGYTPRQAMIWLSQDIVRPRLGYNIFGVWAVTELRQHGRSTVFSDSGFHDEAREVIDALGADNCLLVRLARPGRDFTGDSRGWLDFPDVTTADIANDGDIRALCTRIDATVGTWVHRR